jgi:hypothetical protein
VVVVDQRRGMAVPCEWAEFGFTSWNNNPKCQSRCVAPRHRALDASSFQPGGSSRDRSARGTSSWNRGRCPSHSHLYATRMALMSTPTRRLARSIS